MSIVYKNVDGWRYGDDDTRGLYGESCYSRFIWEELCVDEGMLDNEIYLCISVHVNSHNFYRIMNYLLEFI